jgi:hypothetical protein
MRVKHLKAYTQEALMDEVQRQGGPRLLVPPWLKEHNLRPLLEGYVKPDDGQESKRGKVDPKGVDGECWSGFAFFIL